MSSQQKKDSKTQKPKQASAPAVPATTNHDYAPMKKVTLKE